MNVIILAAGFGTRLYPLTKEKPKALLLVNGRPLIDHLMDNVAKTRPKSVLIVTNNLFYEQFVAWKAGRKEAFPIHILNNGVSVCEKRLGAVTDLYLGACDSRVREGDLLVLSSDNYFDYPLEHFLLQALHHLPKPVIASYDVKLEIEAKNFGVIQIDEHHRITSFEEKPENPKSTLISTGIYLFPRSIPFLLYEYLRLVNGERDRIGDVLAWLSKRVTTVTIPIEGHWCDIGSLETYQWLNQLLNQRSNETI